ncbi:hypothetical protein PsorP6_008693 [Peronosclerospora sorghi]|uniref:Uncharacterized protein n=1 Tax=Peronosclerospora sorghi TaxID=230839 RepID=A0ACC0W1F1_9STRA|nr:hypothetical protein PsorP6_008693 [Peronosclerospora sorghi]
MMRSRDGAASPSSGDDALDEPSSAIFIDEIEMERALGEPALVLCSVCINREEQRDHWMSLRCGDDQALLVRDVCVRPLCPRLQIRNHFCMVHVFEFELSWQGNYSVRVCHGCHVNTLQLYRNNCDVWFILEANEHAVGVHGVERRVKTSSTSAGVSKRSQRSSRKMSQLRRKSGRFIKQQVQKEQMLAFEWSLGNLSLEKSKHLWRDNQKRVKMEKNPTANLESIVAVSEKVEEKVVPDVNVHMDPLEVFCYHEETLCESPNYFMWHDRRRFGHNCRSYRLCAWMITLVEAKIQPRTSRSEQRTTDHGIGECCGMPEPVPDSSFSVRTVHFALSPLSYRMKCLRKHNTVIATGRPHEPNGDIDWNPNHSLHKETYHYHQHSRVVNSW